MARTGFLLENKCAFVLYCFLYPGPCGCGCTLTYFRVLLVAVVREGGGGREC